MKRYSPIALALMLVFVASATAHDTFVLPEKFRVAVGEKVKVGFHSADAFAESASSPKRLKDATLRVGDRSTPLELVTDGKRVSATVTIPSAGHAIVTAVNASATAPMEADEFLEYLKEEGLDQVIAARAKAGTAASKAGEKYTMYTKSILLAGAPNGDYKKAVGLPIEIVPEKDPYSLKANEALPVRVLFRGKPVAGLQLLAASSDPQNAKNHPVGRTDAEGRVTVPVKAGLWRLHVIHMIPVSEPDAQWESFWATLTFEVPAVAAKD